MGYAIWLVPNKFECETLKQLMKFRPEGSSLQPDSRSYPMFHPHITLATFEVLPAWLDLNNLVANPITPPVAEFAGIGKPGNTYLGALKVTFEESPSLRSLQRKIAGRLDELKIAWKSRDFPHMSLFYVEEPMERKRLYSELRYSKQVPGKSGTITQFTGSEVWLVDCSSRDVEKWDRLQSRRLKFFPNPKVASTDVPPKHFHGHPKSTTTTETSASQSTPPIVTTTTPPLRTTSTAVELVKKQHGKDQGSPLRDPSIKVSSRSRLIKAKGKSQSGGKRGSQSTQR